MRFDTEGELQTEDGTVLGRNSDASIDDVNFKIAINVEPGTYYLEVIEFDGATGSYIVHTTLEQGQLVVDAGDTREKATPLALGTPYSEDIAPVDDVDYYRIVVNESGKLTVWTTGEFDTFGELQTVNGVVLSRNDNTSAGYNFRIVYNVGRGRIT